MSETNKIPEIWTENCNTMVDEVWVPTEFHKEIFAKSGVELKKLVKIPEATDIFLWNPQITEPLTLTSLRRNDFNFFSVFKWEHRKGWDILLKSYFEEFSASDNVTLFIHTYLYNDIGDTRNEQKITSLILDFARTELKRDQRTLARVKVLTQEFPRVIMPR